MYVLLNVCFGWVNPEKRFKKHTPSLSSPDGWQDFLFPLLTKLLCLFSYHLISKAGSWKNIHVLSIVAIKEHLPQGYLSDPIRWHTCVHVHV